MRNSLTRAKTWAKKLRADGKFRAAFAAHRYFRLLFSKERTSSALLTIIYRFAIASHLHWPRACLFCGQKLVRELSSLVDSPAYSEIAAQRLYVRICELLGIAGSDRRFDVEAAIGLSEAALFSGRIETWLEMVRKIADSQDKRALAIGSDHQNLRFIDPEIFYTTIGLTFNVDAWIKAGILGIRPPWKTVVLAERNVSRLAANQCLLAYWRKYIEIVEMPSTLRKLSKLSKQLSSRCQYYLRCNNSSVPFPHSSAVQIQHLWEEQKREPLLTLSAEHRERGNQTLREMGIPRDAWFVIFHVREPGFKGGERFRDSDIRTYFGAIDLILSHGGWVIRMGDASMTALPNRVGLIDYARSSFKSDWMDVFLCASARFMVATSSGLATISHAFGVPIAMTNYLPTATTFLTSKDLFIPRLMRHLESGLRLSFDELMNPPFSLGVTDGMYSNVLRVEIIPNTEQEIISLVSEMLDIVDCRICYGDEDNLLQERFKLTSEKWASMINLSGYKVRCRAGRDFLRSHQDLLPELPLHH